MKSQELNLIVVFDAIMTEGSITRAAERLALSQPAVSNALSRMRQQWQDELFVKDGRGIAPTLYARNLWQQIREPLQQLEQAMDNQEFDPASAQRTFRIAVPDAVVDIVWPALRRLIETQAPGINVHAVPYTIINADSVLIDAEVDMVIGGGAPEVHASVLRSMYVYRPSYVVVMRLGHPLATAPMTLQQFAEADHLLVSLSGDSFGVTDRALAEHNIERRVAMTVNHFAVVPKVLKQSDLIAIVPSTTIEDAIFERQLAVQAPPLPLEATPLTCTWHKRQDHDQGLQWLRDNVIALVRAHSEQHNLRLEALCSQYRICPEQAD
ncbi:LysR family transcriptional regulator [uncultured Ferrimonas sp.]|uniref:LysR family transcriptional regulator n=1 Tax=uncultured Ferrimonas sp. TaxID=432640 RepID=UPI0026308FEE|nr:LysR family transcriptional regulator [uncultured Ferrimonas sp.]